MSDRFPFFAGETGTYSSTGPSVSLSGTTLNLGTYPVQTFAEAAADITMNFASGDSCTVTIWSDDAHFARYEGAVWTDASPDTISLAAATLVGTKGTISDSAAVSVVAGFRAPVPVVYAPVIDAGALSIDLHGATDSVCIISLTESLGTGDITIVNPPETGDTLLVFSNAGTYTFDVLAFVGDYSLQTGFQVRGSGEYTLINLKWMPGLDPFMWCNAEIAIDSGLIMTEASSIGGVMAASFTEYTSF